MVDRQKMLIDACDKCKVSWYIASDWALDYTKLKLSELFPKDLMIHVKAYIEIKRVQGVHIFIGGFMEPIFSPFFNIYDPQSQTFCFWGSGNEVMEGTTYDNATEFTAAVTADSKANRIVKFLGGRATIKEITTSFKKIYGIKPALESNGSLNDLYKLMHEKQEKEPANIYSYMLLFFYYYWVNGQTLLGADLDNAQYSDVKPVDWEGFMAQWPLETVPTAYFALSG